MALPTANGVRVQHQRLLPVKRITIAAICAILLFSFATGCSNRPSPQPVTLTYLDVEWDTPDAMPRLAQDLQDFTRQTGIQVRRLPRPDGSLNQLVLWRELLQKGAGAPDVVSIDVVWSGMLGQYLMDLKPYFAADLSSQNPAVVASYTLDDKIVAIPHHAYIGVLMYRPDLLQRYGYQHPPRTWDELETMSARIQAGERAKGDKGFWGYVWQGGIDEDLTCSGLEWQISDGAGRIIEDDKSISVNNPEAIRVWQRAARWVGSISPRGVVAYGKWDAQNVWGSGKAAFLRSWQGDYSLITRGWPFSGSPPVNFSQIGVTSVPAGNAGRAGTLGGNGLAVSRASAHARQSLELVRFLLQRDVELTHASESSELPKGLELYALPSLLQSYRRFDALNQQGGGVVVRPSVVSGQKYEEVTRAYIRAVHSVLTGEQRASVAAADLEKELVEMTGFRKGQPGKPD